MSDWIEDNFIIIISLGILGVLGVILGVAYYYHEWDGVKGVGSVILELIGCFI